MLRDQMLVEHRIRILDAHAIHPEFRLHAEWRHLRAGLRGGQPREREDSDDKPKRAAPEAAGRKRHEGEERKQSGNGRKRRAAMWATGH
jgi:hypothetical protein